MNIFRKDPPNKSTFTENQSVELRPSWQDRSATFLHQIRRFGWDLLGTFFILISVLSLFGFLGFSNGTLLNPWVWFLRHNLGWGSIPFVFSLAVLGVICYRYRAGKSTWLTFGRILALEGAFFSLLALFSIVNGAILNRAEKGLDGGTIGWGLANLLWPTLPLFLAGFIYVILLLVFLVIGLGLLKPIYHLLLKWSDSAEETKPANQSVVKSPAARRKKC